MHDMVQIFFERYGRLPTERDPDYLEMLQMTKYNVIPFPTFKPSKCANCGSCKNDDRMYVDFGLEIDWYGIVYICTHCLKDIAKAANLFTEYANELAAAQNEINELQEKLNQGVELPDKLVKAWEEFKEYYASVQSLGTDSPPNDSSSSSDIPIVPSTNETESDKLGINATKSRTTKSTSSSRRKDTPSLADILNNAGS